jgi:hypothetical protein
VGQSDGLGPGAEFAVGVISRLTGVEASQSQTQATLIKVEENIAGLLRRFDGLLVGEPDKPGFLVRLDRLEQSQARRDKFYGLTATTMSAVLAGIALKVFW